MVALVAMVTFFPSVPWNWKFGEKSLFQVEICLPDPNFKTFPNQLVAPMMSNSFLSNTSHFCGNNNIIYFKLTNVALRQHSPTNIFTSHANLSQAIHFLNKIID